MDDPDLDRSDHRCALAGLTRINRLSRSAGILWPEVERRLRASKSKTLRLLDVACGAGDVGVGLAHCARRRGLAVDIDACDRSEVALEYAAELWQRHSLQGKLFKLDALADRIPEGYHILTCSLFLHHLSDNEAVALLHGMKISGAGLILVNDLRRTLSGWWLARLGVKVLSRSPVVHFDGPASVRAAFTMEEARAIADRAGLHRAIVVPRWPQRFLLSWRTT